MVSAGLPFADVGPCPLVARREWASGKALSAASPLSALSRAKCFVKELVAQYLPRAKQALAELAEPPTVLVFPTLTLQMLSPLADVFPQVREPESGGQS